ncbi:hypothetical protein SUGI_0669670 [Cryptomeria japonica]|nr:hypothetical protein SUGI_0669670 [Cryptomeria japonica]
MDSINKLPQDMIEQILIRMPYAFHNTLIQVCKQWKDVVESDRFYQARIIYGKSEKFICLLHEAGITMYDPVRGSRHPLPPMTAGFIPTKCSRLVFWRRKLVVIGLQHHNRADQYVLVYHFGSTSWHEGMQVPVILSDMWRFEYAASATGSVYIPLSQVYMIHENSWQRVYPIPSQSAVPSAVSIAGMAYLFNTYTGRNTPRIFDPTTRKWIRIDNLILGRLPPRLLGHYDNYLLGLCGTWGWNTIFWDEGAPPPHLNFPLYRRFYMFQADAPRAEMWSHIQTPVEIGNRTVLSVTTAEI